MASTYRAIQPSTRAHETFSFEGLGKRMRSVSEACRECRQVKTRCDGRRPSCRPCTAKGKECHFEGPAGQSRKTTVRLRMRALEKLLAALQDNDPRDAEQLLQRIRATDNILALADSVGSNGSSASSSAAADTPSPSSPPSSATSSAATRTEASRLSTPVSRGTSVSVDASPPLVRLIMPNAAVTKAATDSFYRSSGKLFHVFSPEQTARFHANVFECDSLPMRVQKTSACCLAAMAAIGVQYNVEEFEEGMGDTFYNLAANFFSFFIEEQPLDAIKVCTVMAMYNIMGKSTFALAYVEVGMNMAKRYNLHAKHPQQSGVSNDEWAEYRRTWRTMMFLSSWLSSTLGYVTGSDVNFREMVKWIDLEMDNALEIGAIVQREMTKIALIKADILRMQLAFREMTGPSLQSTMQDLKEWHDRLPEQMQLHNLARSDLANENLLSIFHAHLLYLGAVMLLYRRVASQFVQSFGYSTTLPEQGATHRPGSCEEMVISQSEHGVTAAKHSARILRLMLEKKGIFKRCWVVIFQSQTSCVVLLHSAAQKQLHGFPRESWEDDLFYAATCLEALEFCGTTDVVAFNFYTCLEPIYLRLVNTFSLPPLYPHADAPDYLFSKPPNADPSLVDLSLSLLEALCRPFGDDDSEKKPEQAQRMASPMSSSDSDSMACSAGPVDWGWQKGVKMRWDKADLGFQGGLTACDNVFLGSDHPSGWAAITY